jgi:hypothetical protein
MLFQRENTLGWTMTETCRIIDEVESYHVVRTIGHLAWKSVPYQLPRKLITVEDNIVKERVALGLIEPSWGPYRNVHFLSKEEWQI